MDFIPCDTGILPVRETRARAKCPCHRAKRMIEMIDFSCPGCSERFSVPDNASGKSVRCKKCGNQITIPTPSAPLATAPTPMRTRRLNADFTEMKTAFANWPAIRIKSTTGDPPDLYVIEFLVKSLDKNGKAEPIPRDHHLAEIQLTSDYPRLGPKCRLLTPIFHPNIDPATICVGDHWTAGERLVDLVIRIGEMIAYQAYNIKSPLNGEAAMWADLNKDKLPLDSREL